MLAAVGGKAIVVLPESTYDSNIITGNCRNESNKRTADIVGTPAKKWLLAKRNKNAGRPL
jgi:hypothetical protein